MRSYRGPAGDERIWFEPSEIEQIAQDELRKASLLPTAANPVVNLERFIEQHLRVRLDQHAALDVSVLGVTEFFVGRPPLISINRDLTGSALDEDESQPGILGRWRATLAHEAAHVLLHRSLYEFASSSMSLFESSADTAPKKQLQRCLKRDVTYRRVSEWREVQANIGMAALLMPKSSFMQLARAEIAALLPGRTTLTDGECAPIVARMASKCSVSRQATRIRLETLRLLTTSGQQEL